MYVRGVLSPRDNPRHPQFSLDELTVCVAEAAANDFGVMAHAQGTPGSVTGTDSGVFDHGGNTEELGLLAKVGMAPADALVAATSSAADSLGMGDRIGRIAPGQRADLTIVSGDPYDFVGYRDRIAYVLRGGHVARDYVRKSTPAPHPRADLARR